jgi:hypothetical protein
MHFSIKNTLKNNHSHIPKQKIHMVAPRLVAQRSWQGFPTYASWVQASVCTSVIPAVSYLPTELAGCSVGPMISRGVRKLARIPQVIKKKKKIRTVDQ